MTRRRLDAELVRRGLARSRDEATELIAAGAVLVGGVAATKPATQVDAAASLVVRREGDEAGYVSRGAHKLAGALDDLAVDPSGLRCLDAGASTGGFTDVLLRRGAEHVVAVDVGYGQLAWRLQQDVRVTVRDRTNVRTLVPELIDGPVDLVVADLSFIGLRVVLPALASCCREAGQMLLMVKPQFEVGRDRVGPRGVVRDPALRAEAVSSIADMALGLGWSVVGVAASRLPGPSGNVEYFVHLRRGARPVDPLMIRRAVEEGPQ
jgi:23S rRNA (cytidine1920-2'-O)/16S rRNA (cytidine1409-2'-O)-methyltransferase